MTNQKRRRFWIDPPLQIQMLAMTLFLVAGSLFLVDYSVFHSLQEASQRSHQVFNSIDWVMETIRGPLAISAAISLLASVLIALIWSHRFAGPLRVLAAAMARLGHCNFSVPVRIRRFDTHQELVGEFSQMQHRLQERLAADMKAVASASARLKAALPDIPEANGARQAVQAVAAELESLPARYQL